MTRTLKPVRPVVAYSVPQAAAAVGCGETFIRSALDAGVIEQHFLSPSKPVILYEDLRAWVEVSPTEREM